MNQSDVDRFSQQSSCGAKQWRMTMDEVEKLKAENDALRKRMEKLEDQVNPPPRER